MSRIVLWEFIERNIRGGETFEGLFLFRYWKEQGWISSVHDIYIDTNRTVLVSDSSHII